MLRVVAVLLLALLVPWVPAHAAEEAAYLPVQVVVDPLSEVMERAIAEGELAGTDHGAQALLAEMAAFAEGLDADVAWPEEAVAHRIDAGQAYPYVRDVIATASLVPQEVATLARVGAQCHDEGATASVQDALAWTRQARGADGRARALFADLEGLAAEAPRGVDPEPVRDALERVRAWWDEVQPDTRECLRLVRLATGAQAILDAEEAARRDGTLDPDDPRLGEPVLHAFLIPNSTYPTGTVRVVGSWAGEAGPVRIAAPGGADATVSRDAHGAFRHAFQVGAGVPLGVHPVVVEVGDARAELPLRVARAPVHLTLDVPDRVSPGGTLRIGAQLATPAGELLPDRSTLGVQGGVNGTIEMAGAFGAATFPAPEVGPWLEGTVRFNGTDRLAPAEADFRVRVELPARGPAQGGPGVVWEWVAPAVEGWGLLVLVVLGVLLAAPLVLRMLRGAPALPGLPGPAGAARPTREGVPRFAASLVAAFSALAAYLVRTGHARASDTARELARRLERHGVPIGGVVRVFERVRYGGAPERDELGRPMQVWATRAAREVAGGEE